MAKKTAPLKREFITLPIDQLVEAKWNYKDFDSETSQRLMRQLKTNLERNQQVESILVRELDDGSYEVVNGNHRLRAMREVGIPEAVVCNIGPVSLHVAKKMAVALNETRFQRDEVRFAHTIADLTVEETSLDLSEELPFKVDELDNYKRLLDFDWKEPEKKEKEEPKHTDPEEEEKEKVTLHLSAEGAAAIKKILAACDKLGDESVILPTLADIFEENVAPVILAEIGCDEEA